MSRPKTDMPKDGTERSRKSRDATTRKMKKVAIVLRHAPPKWLKRWRLNRIVQGSTAEVGRLTPQRIRRLAEQDKQRTIAWVSGDKYGRAFELRREVKAWMKGH